MTEEEAKNKWCPHVRHMIWPGNDPSGGNQPKASSLCTASDCMMWQKTDIYWAKDGIKASIEELNKHITPEHGGFETAIEGRCGLAK